jgi:hypothetical protein
LLAIGLALFATSAVAAPKDCALNLVTEFDLQTNAQGEFLIPVSINGTTRLFTLQMGDAFSQISKGFADQLQLRRTKIPREIEIGTKTKAMDLAISDSVSIGDIHGKNTQFVEFPDEHWDNSSAGGEIGLDIISNFDLELDLSSHKMRLFSQDHCEGEVVYWAKTYAAVPIRRQRSGEILLSMTLDGKDVDVGLDSSAMQSEMTLSEAKKLFDIDIGSPGLVPTAKDGFYTYPFKLLTVDGLAVQNPAILIHRDDPKEPACKGEYHFGRPGRAKGRDFVCYGGADLRLTISQLSKLRLYFAFKEKMLYLTAADAN